MCNYKKKYFIYTGCLVTVILFAHFLFSFFLAKMTTSLYSKVILNVTNFEAQERNHISFNYLSSNLKKNKQNTLLIMGSSFSYGYSLSAQDIYSEQLQAYFPNNRIINASVIGESGLGILQKIFLMKKNNIKSDILILEISLPNLYATTGLDRQIYKANLGDRMDSLGIPYLSFYLSHPYGLSAFKILELNRVYTIGQSSEHPYNPATLPNTYFQKDSYFKQHINDYHALLTTLFMNASQISKQVYFFVSPIYKEGVLSSQFKLDDIRDEINILNNICKTAPKNVHCLNPGLQFPKEDFMNITHFNAHGHKTMAKWLAMQIRESMNADMATKRRLPTPH